MPEEFWDWWMVERTGWTLEQVRALSVNDFLSYLAIRDGRTKYENSFYAKQKRKGTR